MPQIHAVKNSMAFRITNGIRYAAPGPLVPPLRVTSNFYTGKKKAARRRTAFRL
jgi:hypothetical protein